MNDGTMVDGDQCFYYVINTRWCGVWSRVITLDEGRGGIFKFVLNCSTCDHDAVRSFNFQISSSFPSRVC